MTIYCYLRKLYPVIDLKVSKSFDNIHVLCYADDTQIYQLVQTAVLILDD